MLYRVHNKELLLGLHCHGIMLNRVVTNAKRFCSCYNSCKNPRESVDVITRKHERKRCSKKKSKRQFSKTTTTAAKKIPTGIVFCLQVVVDMRSTSALVPSVNLLIEKPS